MRDNLVFKGLMAAAAGLMLSWPAMADEGCSIPDGVVRQLQSQLAVVVKLPGGRRPFPGLHQGYVIQRSQSHSALAAVPLEPINPGPTDRAGLWIKSNLQIQAAPIWIPAGSGGLQLEGRKSMQRQYRDPTRVFPGVFPGDGLIIPHDFGWNATKI